jgi:hypothetical protein
MLSLGSYPEISKITLMRHPMNAKKETPTATAVDGEIH